MSTANVTAKIAACRGGWPAALQPSSDKGKLLIAKNYVKTVCDKDISRAAKRNGMERFCEAK